MKCPHLPLLVAAAAALLVDAGPARGGEDIMPMIASSYAYTTPDEKPAASGKGAGLDIGPLLGMQPSDEPPPAARPQLHKNVIKLTLPAGVNRAALDDELAPFAPEPTLSRALADTDAPLTKASPTDIPGLMTPETLAALPSRNFREDLKDLVSLDGKPAAPEFERFDSAAYTMPISTATYIAPAPAEFVPEMTPVASESLPRPGELSLPAPIILESMPPLPYLDPVAVPRLPVDDFSSKTEALIRVPSLNVNRTSVTPPSHSGPAGMPSLRPPSMDTSGEYYGSFENETFGGDDAEDWAAPSTLFGLTPAPSSSPSLSPSAGAPAFGPDAALGDETPRLAGPLLGIQDRDAQPPRSARKKTPSYDEPALIGGVPALTTRQLSGKNRSDAGPDAALASQVVREESGRSFDPLRSIRSLFGGKSK